MQSPGKQTVDNLPTSYNPSSYAAYSSDSVNGDVNSRAYALHLPALDRTATGASSSSTGSSSSLLPHPRRTRKSFWSFHHEVSPIDHEKLPLSSSPSADKGKKRSMGFFHGWKVILFGSWLNVLIIFIPASWIINSILQNSETLVFIFCIFAMIPLVRLHDLSTTELAFRSGGAKTGLLNASLSNLVELVVATTALRECQLRVVQASLIGSMLSKLLLVLGLCMFAGGLRFSEQYGFDPAASQIHSSLLSISVGALLMPAAYHFALSGGTNVASALQRKNLLKMSRGVAIILLIVYIAYLAFHFYSHSHLFKDNKASTLHDAINPRQTNRPMRAMKRLASLSKSRTVSPIEKPIGVSRSTSLADLDSSPRSKSPYASASDISLPLSITAASLSGPNYGKSTAAMPTPALESTVRLVRQSGSPAPATELPRDTRHPYPGLDDDSGSDSDNSDRSQTQPPLGREPRLSYPMTLLCLVAAGVLVALNAERLVDALEIMEDTNENISTEWIGLIVLPTVSVLAECITAVNVSRKDQLTLSISVAVGSTIQTALFVIPLMVMFGWVLDKPLALLFDPFETIVLFLSVHTMNYVIADGKGNWLEGALLICLYVIIAVAFWFYPGSTFSTTLALCASDA